jgi:hypothetical protein
MKVNLECNIPMLLHLESLRLRIRILAQKITIVLEYHISMQATTAETYICAYCEIIWRK